MFQGSQFEKTGLLMLITQGCNDSGRLQMATLGNSYFPLHPDQLTQPYQYSMAYTLGSPYTYFTNPSFTTSTYVSTLQEPSEANSLVQSPPNIPIKDEPIEQPKPIYIKTEPPEPKKKSCKRIKAVENSIQSQAHSPQQISEERPRSPSDLNVENCVNFEVKNIFVKLIKALVSQQDLSTVKIQLQKQLNNLTQYKTNKFFSIICQKLDKKFSDYKKTKEELIKYIIRRTYQNYKLAQGTSFKPELDNLFLFHNRNLVLYKSMNAYFMKEEISNEHFLQIYKKFLAQLDQQLQKYNQEKIQKLALILAQVWAQRDLKSFLQYKKLPWNIKFQERVRELAFSLLKEYSVNLAQNDQKVNPTQPKLQANPVHPKLQAESFYPKYQVDPVDRQLSVDPFKLKFQVDPYQYKLQVYPDPNT